MKPGNRKSLLKQYLLLNFLVATLVPVLILIGSAGIFPTKGNAEAQHANSDNLIMIGAILAIFVVFSWIFFYRIRKRLLRLREAMILPADNGIPNPIQSVMRDEIGQLDDSFNQMVGQLEQSRLREKEEEALRRQLIANLSHDLRSPLTTIRGHAYRLKQERLSGRGQESLDLMDKKIGQMGQLIDNLQSYTLLTSGKYPYRPVKTDMVRLARTSFAAWYPVFEGMGFRMELELPETTFFWDVDPGWMERILDNVFQNVKRHADAGKYIGVKAETGSEWIIIEDRGPGMNGETASKGAGIGLSIAALMLQEMKLQWELESNETGTKIKIQKGLQV